MLYSRRYSPHSPSVGFVNYVAAEPGGWTIFMVMIIHHMCKITQQMSKNTHLVGSLEDSEFTHLFG